MILLYQPYRFNRKTPYFLWSDIAARLSACFCLAPPAGLSDRPRRRRLAGGAGLRRERQPEPSCDGHDLEFFRQRKTLHLSVVGMDCRLNVRVL